jgi:hypothetical protein
MLFSVRRIRNTVGSITLTIALLFFLRIYGTPLYRMQTWSGWILFALIVFLLLYKLRKKLPMLPIGSAALWLQCHAYFGLISVAMFAQHINFRIPTGHFEILFAAIFIITACTGIIGLILCRVIPKYLTNRGEEVIFERIPILRAKLRQQAQSLVTDCATATKSSVLFEYYQFHLANYFFEPKNLVFHLFGSTTHWHHMVNKHQTFCRFLSNEEKKYADQLLTYMRQKDDLDFHFTLQGLLKAWPFLHLPLSFVLLILSLLHLTLVYAFIGGV